MTVAEKIKQTYDPYYVVPINVWESFTELGQIVKTPSDSIIKGSGNTEKYLHYILEGCAGIVLWNKNNFVCVDLSFEGDFVSDYASFLLQKSSSLEVLAFEECKLFRIPRENFELIGKIPVYGEKIRRISAERLFIHKQNQQIEMLTQTAKSRYNVLQTSQPDKLHRIPQKYIASYLGITAQSLSRIRAEIFKGQLPYGNCENSPTK